MRGSHLRFEKDTRYYVLRLEPGLFGEWCLARVWGGKQSRSGGNISEYYEEYDEAQRRLEHLASFREKRRGYTRIEKGSEA